MKLFWVAVVYKPLDKEGELPRVVDYELVVANDEKDAAFRMGSIKRDLDPDRIEVAVRPF